MTRRRPPRTLPGLFRELREALVREDQATAMRLIALMTPADLLLFDACFEAWIHESQLPPAIEGWRTWLMRAGRGFGKTRAGAEWITGLATQKRRPVRIALVGATIDEVRKVMVEGESGLLSVARRLRLRPFWEPSLGRLTWPGGSVAETFSGENPDGLRGFQHHYAWCDELAKWARPAETWDNLQLGLRGGERPRALITTTPRPIPLLKRIESERWTVTTRGRTDQNVNLAESFYAAMAETYGGTRLGRQELDGELIEDVEGALWTRAMAEQARGEAPADFARVVVGIDPPASATGDECGIVVCGLDGEGIGWVLADRSAGGLSSEGWAREVVRTAVDWSADLVVAETNQGGEMVEAMLRGADCALPVRPVKARFGKGKRAEPVAQRFATGKARFAGAFPALEDQLCGLTPAGGYAGPGRSPDRADAMVWAMTELLLAPKGEPSIRRL